jgi:succinyl-CoA synthetase alpha subunit
MAILVNRYSQVVVQGITGKFGTQLSELMLDYGTRIVAGVTPGKGGQIHLGVPVYDSVHEATKKHKLDASLVSVPAPFVKDAALEAMDAGISFMVIISDLVPLHDELSIKAYARGKKVSYIGPNTPGIIVPAETSLGMMSGSAVMPGDIAVVSRSGTLSDEVASHLSEQDIGQSVVIGLGGDPIVGLRMIDILRLLKEDKETKGVLIVCEIGGTMEEETAEYIKAEFDKPVVAFLAGRTAPRGKVMGHAGAIIMGERGTAESKIDAFEAAGVPVASTLQEVPKLASKMLETLQH